MTGTELTKYEGNLDDRLSWDDVIINKVVKETLRDFCSNDLLDLDSYQRWGDKPPKGILLYGPPGTGKSLILKIIGAQTPFPFFPIDVGSTGSKYINQSAGNLDKYFKRVNNIAADPNIGAALICFDEIDGLLMPRDDVHTHAEDHKVVTTFTKYMNGIDDQPGVYVIAATNMELEHMDPAVIRAGRFDIKFYISLPDESSRTAIFKLHLEKREKIAYGAGNYGFMEKIDYNLLAQKTSNFSGADIDSIIGIVCNQKRRQTTRTKISSSIITEDLLNIIANYKSSSQQGKKEQLGFKRL